MNGLFQDKDDPSGRWSSFRFVIISLAVVVLVRLLAPVFVAVWSTVVLDAPRVIEPVDQWLSVLGIVALVAYPLREWMKRTAPEEVPTMLGGLFSGVRSWGGAGWSPDAPSSLQRASRPLHGEDTREPVPYSPPPGHRTDDEWPDDVHEGDEP